MDPTHTTRPTLDVENLDISKRQNKHRQKAFQHRLKFILNTTKHDKHLFSHILSKYRKLQKKRLGTKDEDPDPYEPDYIFYCLQNPRKD
jgi:hypothetical protein